MRALFLVLLLALQLFEPSASLIARWDGPGRATLIYSGPGCVYRNQVLLPNSCTPRAAMHLLTLGGPDTDAAYRPTGTPDEVFRLVWSGQELASAQLRSLVYLPTVTR